MPAPLRSSLLAAALVWSAHGQARAHVCMDAPVSRVGPSCTAAAAQKVGPCGVNRRGAQVTEFSPGQTITLQLNETIDHPSHYRIAFSVDGDVFDDATRGDDDESNADYVLLDEIPDEAAARQSIEVTLPNLRCERCSLQLIQVMYDRLGGADQLPDEDALYFACADIALRAPGDAGAAPQASETGTDAASPARDDESDGESARRDAGPSSADESDGEAAWGEDGCGVSRPGATGGPGGALALAVLFGVLARRPRRVRGAALTPAEQHV